MKDIFLSLHVMPNQERKTLLADMPIEVGNCRMQALDTLVIENHCNFRGSSIPYFQNGNNVIDQHFKIVEMTLTTIYLIFPPGNSI